MPPRSEQYRNGQDDSPVAEQLACLTGELRVLRDVLDEIREQLDRLATNGIPQWTPSLDDQQVSPAPVLSVPEHRRLPRLQSPEAQIVREVIERLETGIASIATDQLSLFVNALDEVRDDLVAALKGDPQQSLRFEDSHDDGPVALQPVLETEPAQEPAASRAADAGTSNAPPGRAQRTLFEAHSPAVPNVLFEPGQAVLVRAFRANGSDADAEIVAVDDAFNNATVELLHSGEHVTVSQELLTKVEPDPLGPEAHG